MAIRKLSAAVVLASALAAPARAATPVPHTFTAGTPAKAAEVNANFQSIVDQLAQAMPAGTVLPYAGTAAPAGFLLCDGAAVSRTTYADLFAVVGERFGRGDGSTTFNLPDLRGTFVRGATNVAPATFAPGQVYPLNGDYISIPGHRLNRTGFPVRFDNTGGALPSPLASNTTYFAIVDGDNVKVATTEQNAFAGTAIDLTTVGTGTHRLLPAADPDIGSRVASAPGGATGDAVGSAQADALQNVTGSVSFSKAGESMGTPTGAFGGSTVGVQSVAAHVSGPNMSSAPNIAFDASLVARTSSETRPRNVSLSWIVRF